MFMLYTNQSTDLQSESLDWFLYKGNRVKHVKHKTEKTCSERQVKNIIIISLSCCEQKCLLKQRSVRFVSSGWKKQLSKRRLNKRF